MSYPYLSDLIKALTGYTIFLPIPMFGLCVAAALLIASGLLSRELNRLFANGKIGPATIRSKDATAQISLNRVNPQQIVPDFTFAVMLAGIIGARVFHILEHTRQFIANPLSMIFSTSGLSIFGGLIFGTVAGLVCVRHWRLPVRPLLDATAPSMMLGYAIGRIGCQVSGDGDWGIVANMALKPVWLPSWLWAQTYDNNIFGLVIAPPGVYPTPLYETGMGLICFLILWALRKNPYQCGWLFSVYLLLAGAERFVIEQIRVNPVLSFGGIHATQAEMIAVTIFVLGLIGVLVLSKRVLSTRLTPS
jgi:phosphatidylglycerol:prolipoprotein diacylglycerol transferase